MRSWWAWRNCSTSSVNPSWTSSWTSSGDGLNMRFSSLVSASFAGLVLSSKACSRSATSFNSFSISFIIYRNMLKFIEKLLVTRASLFPKFWVYKQFKLALYTHTSYWIEYCFCKYFNKYENCKLLKELIWPLSENALAFIPSCILNYTWN